MIPTFFYRRLPHHLLAMIVLLSIGMTRLVAQQVMFTRIIDPDISGGRGCPKMIELFVSGSVDLSDFDLIRAANGQAFGATSSDIRSLSGTYADQFVYIYFSTCGESRVLSAFPSLAGEALLSMSNASGNGDDGFRLVERSTGLVKDQLLDESGNLLYLDGCLKRIYGTGPLGYWESSHWEACDGSGSNGSNVLSGLEGDPLINTVNFGDFGFIPAPVSWLSLRLEEEEGRVLIHWSTASEENNASFSIERFRDPYERELLGEIKGKGNTEEISHYRFLDEFPLGQPAYYQIRQTDFDGKSSLSPLLSFRPAPKGLAYDIWVNSGNNLIDISFRSPHKQKGMMVIQNMNGEVLGKGEFYADQRSLQIQTSALTAGVYFLSIHSGGKRLWKKILIR